MELLVELLPLLAEILTTEIILDEKETRRNQAIYLVKNVTIASAAHFLNVFPAHRHE